MTKFNALQIQEALEDIGYDVRDDYSGRNMYGKECPGVEAGSEAEIFTMFVELAENDPVMAKELAKSAKTDNMGLGLIVYWPRFTYEREAA